MTNLFSGSGNYEETRKRKADDRFEDRVVQEILAARGFKPREIVELRREARVATDTAGFTCKWLNEAHGVVDFTWELEARRTLAFDPARFLNRPQRTKLWGVYADRSNEFEDSLVLVFRTALFGITVVYGVLLDTMGQECNGGMLVVPVRLGGTVATGNLIVKSLTRFLERYES